MLRFAKPILVHWALAVGVVLSAGVGLLFYYITAELIDRDNEKRFANIAHTAQYTIDARIRAYTNMVRATASLFNANGNVTREQFRRFVDSLHIKENYPAIDTVNYVQWLTDAQRDAFEAKMRDEAARANDGRPPFRILPPGRRPEYSVVLYIEPNPGWKMELGRDLDASPVTHRAMAESRDTGILATSGAPIKAMKAFKRVGFGMRLPLYRAGAPVSSVEERRAAYFGSVGVSFNVEELVKGVLSELPIEKVRMSLFNKVISADGLSPSRRQLIYDSNATSEAPTPALAWRDDPSLYYVILPVEFNGRKWSAHFSVPKQRLYKNLDSSFPLLALLAGFATTMLMYGVIYTLTSSRRRSVELAKAMTAELRESQAQLLQSHDQLRELAAHLDNIKEDERKRIAREIHDELGQNLLALRIDAELLVNRTREHHPRLHARAKATLAHIDATIKSVRQIINDLRPNVLDLGLNAAAAWQIEQFRRLTGIRSELVEYDADIKVNDQGATGLFRILQESLSNVLRHASATSVRVDLRTEGGWVWMSVRDDGVGLAPAGRQKRGAFGLIGIEERVRILGGTFSITGAAGQGTVVTVGIPKYAEEGYEAELPARAPVNDDFILI